MIVFELYPFIQEMINCETTIQKMKFSISGIWMSVEFFSLMKNNRILEILGNQLVMESLI